MPIFVACTVVFSASCSVAPARHATFRAKADSFEAGSLKGPYSGQVLDKISGKPIKGALVYAVWSFKEGNVFSQASGYEEDISSTDLNGYYRVPKLPRKKFKDGALVDFSLVIYKRGYVAYRSDRRYSDFSPRRDFTQVENKVSLDRFRDDYSHARHLRYIAGGEALKELTRHELADAADEMSGQRGVTEPLLEGDLLPKASKSIVAATLLGEEEIRALTGFEGELESGPLGGEADTAFYSSQHFRALGKPETYDIAIRFWKTSEEDAGERFKELAATLPGVVETDTIADASLQATEGDIFGIAFLAKEQSLVVLISCGKLQCTDVDVAEKLAAKAFDNILEQSGRP